MREARAPVLAAVDLVRESILGQRDRDHVRRVGSRLDRDREPLAARDRERQCGCRTRRRFGRWRLRPVLPEAPVDEHLRRVDDAAPGAARRFALPNHVSRVRIGVVPVARVPVVDMELERGIAGIAAQCRQPALGRRARTAPFARVELDQVRALRVRARDAGGIRRAGAGRGQQGRQQEGTHARSVLGGHASSIGSHALRIVAMVASRHDACRRDAYPSAPRAMPG